LPTSAASRVAGFCARDQEPVFQHAAEVVRVLHDAFEQFLRAPAHRALVPDLHLPQRVMQTAFPTLGSRMSQASILSLS
jgi:hypothetical protein